MPSFIVTGGPIEHDAQRYELNDEIELTDGQAAQLLALGEVAAKVVAKVAGKVTKNGKAKDEGSQE